MARPSVEPGTHLRPCAIRHPERLSGVPPHAQRRMRGNAPNVLVGRQHRQLVMDAELCEQGVDGTDLYTGASPGLVVRRIGSVLEFWRPAGFEPTTPWFVGGRAIRDFLLPVSQIRPSVCIIQKAAGGY